MLCSFLQFHGLGTSRITHPLFAVFPYLSYFLTPCTVFTSQVYALAFESMSTKTEGENSIFGVITLAVIMEIHPKLASEYAAQEKAWAFGTEIPGLQIWPRHLPAV